MRTTAQLVPQLARSSPFRMHRMAIAARRYHADRWCGRDFDHCADEAIERRRQQQQPEAGDGDTGSVEVRHAARTRTAVTAGTAAGGAAAAAAAAAEEEQVRAFHILCGCDLCCFAGCFRFFAYCDMVLQPGQLARLQKCIFTINKNLLVCVFACCVVRSSPRPRVCMYLQNGTTAVIRWSRAPTPNYRR